MEDQVVAEIAQALCLGHADLGASARAISARRARRRPAPRRTASSSPSRSTPRPGDPHRKDKRQPGPARHCSPRSQTNSNGPWPSATCPGRRSASPRRRRSGRASRRSAAAAAPARDANCSRSRMRASAALVREPSSRASVRNPLDRHAAVEHHAAHRAVARHAGVGDDRVAGLAKNTRSTGSSPRRAGPAARPSASRLGRSTTISASGASRASRPTAAGRSGTSPPRSATTARLSVGSVPPLHPFLPFRPTKRIIGASPQTGKALATVDASAHASAASHPACATRLIDGRAPDRTSCLDRLTRPMAGRRVSVRDRRHAGTSAVLSLRTITP